MKATVYGVGYVGLVQAAVLAEAGHLICCVDTDEEKIARIRQGDIPIYEPGLASIVARNVAEGRLILTTKPEQGVAFASLQFIAVGTPEAEDGSADLQYVFNIAELIAANMTANKVIINKSTVPVGTVNTVFKLVNRVLIKRGVTFTADVVSNPEFLKEGSAVKDCKSPDRIIIGTESAAAEAALRELYAPFNRNREKIIVMDAKSAELTKYAANCMLAAKISFMNEMANISDVLGADIEKVRQGIGADPRIGTHFIYPGCGYGGSCFPKDISALIHSVKQSGFKPQILESVQNVNDRQKDKLYSYICDHYAVDSAAQKPLAGKVFALWGLSFKPNTDDIRGAPSRSLIEALWAAGAKVQAFDPAAMNAIQSLYGERADLVLASSKESALNGASALVVCTEWQNFKAPDFDEIKGKLSDAVIFDGRNLYSPELLAQYGLIYHSIGRPQLTAKG
jgi:UDPglucose 6-dehydrogenase